MPVAHGRGIRQPERLFHILVTFPTALLRLATMERDTFKDVADYRNPGCSADAPGYLHALVVSSLPFTLPGKRHRDQRGDAVEEAVRCKLVGNKAAKQLPCFGMSAILELIQQAAGVRVSLVEEEGCPSLNGNSSPEEPHKPVVTGITGIACTGEALVAAGTHHLFRNGQTPSADGTRPRSKGVYQTGKHTNRSRHRHQQSLCCRPLRQSLRQYTS